MQCAGPYVEEIKLFVWAKMKRSNSDSQYVGEII